MSGTALPTVERCIHDMWPAGSCSACHPQHEPAPTTALEAYAVVTAWHRGWCRGCSTDDMMRMIEVGEPVGFVRDVGPCCADCIGATP